MWYGEITKESRGNKTLKYTTQLLKCLGITITKRLVFGYIPNNNKYLPYSEEGIRDKIRLHHAKC